jgi:hypothetical protein
MPNLKARIKQSAVLILVCSFLMYACVPQPVKPVSVERFDVIYFVKYKGETLQSISQTYTGKASNWKLLRAYNPNLKDKALTKGTRVRIPTKLLKKRVFIKPTPTPIPPTPTNTPTHIPTKAIKVDNNVEILPVPSNLTVDPVATLKPEKIQVIRDPLFAKTPSPTNNDISEDFFDDSIDSTDDMNYDPEPYVDNHVTAEDTQKNVNKKNADAVATSNAAESAEEEKLRKEYEELMKALDGK